MEGPKTPMRAMARLISYMHSDVFVDGDGEVDSDVIAAIVVVDEC